MKILQDIEPRRVLHYFEDLCAIPHGSGNMQKISDYCVAFATAHGLSYTRDAANNVVIRKPASPGYEDHPTVILQGHLDMVCVKKPGCTIDLTADGLRLQMEGDWLTAEGTSLGGDDGIAIAMALAILEDTTLPHPPLEAVFTTDEETGLYGAAALDPRLLQGRILLNLDMEEEGSLTVGCAGGARLDMALPLPTAPTALPGYEISVTGLLGGHSGVEIDKGRQNAAILLGKLLHSLPFPWQLARLEGGDKDNAIPRQATALIVCAENPASYAAAFVEANRAPADPGLTVTVTPASVAAATGEDLSRRVAAFLATVKNGVQAMSATLPGVVQTSLNQGVLYTADGMLHMGFSVRSSVGREKDALLTYLREQAAALDATACERGHYPAWEYRADSPLQQVAITCFEKQYGRRPQVMAIHAGLECGIFSEKLPGLDAISFGPDIVDVHTTEERLSLSSTARTYAYLTAVLAAL